MIEAQALPWKDGEAILQGARICGRVVVRIRDLAGNVRRMATGIRVVTPSGRHCVAYYDREVNNGTLITVQVEHIDLWIGGEPKGEEPHD